MRRLWNDARIPFALSLAGVGLGVAAIVVALASPWQSPDSRVAFLELALYLLFGAVAALVSAEYARSRQSIERDLKPWLRDLGLPLALVLLGLALSSTLDSARDKVARSRAQEADEAARHRAFSAESIATWNDTQRQLEAERRAARGRVVRDSILVWTIIEELQSNFRALRFNVGMLEGELRMIPRDSTRTSALMPLSVTWWTTVKQSQPGAFAYDSDLMERYRTIADQTLYVQTEIESREAFKMSAPRVYRFMEALAGVDSLVLRNSESLMALLRPELTGHR